jgi:GT2 family glycosyltransferase
LTPNPEITIVVPTHERPEKVRALLDSIRQYGGERVSSVIVVDDSSAPSDLASAYADLRLEHLRLPKRVFISRAKNLGWKRARTDFVFFIDDDNVIDGRTVDGVFGMITTDASTGAVMPAVAYKTKPDLVWVYATPFRDRSMKLDLMGRNLPRNPALENRLVETNALPNASIIRREALEQVGGFDERLVVNSSMDLALRLKAKGWKVLAYTGVFIYHDVEPPGKLGWWARHGAVDPERVRYEIRDWFIIMGILHGTQRFYRVRAVAESTRFVVPNALAYVVRGPYRRRAHTNLVRGYVEGLLLTNR